MGGNASNDYITLFSLRSSVKSLNYELPTVGSKVMSFLEFD